MKKKGFTLIELLAVIIILAVIALIATPLIMSVINDAKRNSFKDSAYGIIKAVQLRVAQEQINEVDGQNVSYIVNVITDAINYNGEKPDSGWARVDVDGNVELYITKGEWCVYKNDTTGEKVEFAADLSTCTSNITTISKDDNSALITEAGVDKPSNEKYLISTSDMYTGGSISKRAIVKRNSADAMKAWFSSEWEEKVEHAPRMENAISINGSMARPFCLKEVLGSDGKISASYVVFVVTPEMASSTGMAEGTYQLAHKLDVTELPYFTADVDEETYKKNLQTLRTAFNGSGVCMDLFDGFSCSVSGFSVVIHDNGLVSADDGGHHGCTISGDEEGYAACYDE